MKKSIFLIFTLLFYPFYAFAAGGEINGNIVQESSMRNITIAGTPKIGITKHNDNQNVDKDLNSTVNTIINSGKIQGYVYQKSNLTSGTALNIEANTLENEGNVNLVIQEGIMTDSNIIKIKK